MRAASSLHMLFLKAYQRSKGRGKPWEMKKAYSKEPGAPDH